MNLTIAALFALVLIMDALLVFTPWLMPETECFAVTVPHGARSKEPLKGYMRAYAVRMAIASALCLLAWPLAFGPWGLDLSTERGTGLFALLITFVMCGPVLASFAFMLHYRRLVQQVKREQNWTVEHQRFVAIVGPEDFPRPISVLWNLVYVPIIVGMMAFALLNYDRFPDMIPMNADINGTVVEYTPKSVGAVLFPALVTAYLGVMLTASHIGIVRSKKPIDPDAPASSALAYGSFARTQSILLVVGGMLIAVGTGASFYASSLGILSLQSAAIVEMVVVLSFVAVVLAISARQGQSGGRIAAAAPEGSMAHDEDAFWKLGYFYINRDDPSVFVPQRFGIGWTVNMGNPKTWVILALFTVLTAAFVWGSIAITQ